MFGLHERPLTALSYKISDDQYNGSPNYWQVVRASQKNMAIIMDLSHIRQRSSCPQYPFHVILDVTSTLKSNFSNLSISRCH